MRTQDTFLHTSNCVAHVKTVAIFIPARMEITAVLYFLRNGVKLRFYSFGYHFRGKYAGVQKGAGLRWRPQNAKHFEALTEPAGETHPSALGFQ